MFTPFSTRREVITTIACILAGLSLAAIGVYFSH